MLTYRHAEAQHQDRERRWHQENELVRPYSSFGLTTRTPATSFARRVSCDHVLIVTPTGTRRLYWPLAERFAGSARGRLA